MQKQILNEINITEIKPYEKNPRRNDGKAVDQVAHSIEQVGYITPIIVDENNVVLAGHTRLKALKSLGYDKIPFVVKYTGLDEEKKKKYRVLDNKSSEYSEWDMLKLSEEFTAIELKELGFDFFKDSKADLDFDNMKIDIDVNRDQNFILVLCESDTDFVNAQQKLNLNKVVNPKNRKVGIGRVVSYKDLICLMK